MTHPDISAASDGGRFRTHALRGLAVAGVMTLAACNIIDPPIEDDYRETRVVIRGTVADMQNAPTSGAAVELMPISPAFLRGDTVTTDAQGRFQARLSMMGVGSFDAEVRVRARAPNGAVGDIVLPRVRLLEDREGQLPDTLEVRFRLAAEPEPAAAQTLPLQQILSLVNSGIETPRFELITNAEQWAVLWDAIYARRAPGQKPPLPVIDFNATSLVLAATGTRGAQGFGFDIEQVRAHDDVLFVSVVQRIPCGTLPAQSQQVRVVSVQRVASRAHSSEMSEIHYCR